MIFLQNEFKLPIDNSFTIVSLVPSQTELLVYLGLEKNIIGITKFCIHPPHLLNNIKHIGGTKNIQIDSIKKLKPSIVIGNKEENVKEQLDLLSQSFPILLSDINNLNDTFNMIDFVGNLFSKKEESKALKKLILNEKIKLNINNIPSVAYCIWHDPIMVAANSTFINSMIEEAGFVNCFKKQHRYPQITIDVLKEIKPTYLFLSTEPFPFNAKYVNNLQKFLSQTKVILVDGEMFSWYGNRLIKSYRYFYNLRKELNID